MIIQTIWSPFKKGVSCWPNGLVDGFVNINYKKCRTTTTKVIKSTTKASSQAIKASNPQKIKASHQATSTVPSAADGPKAFRKKQQAAWPTSGALLSFFWLE